MHTTEAFTGKVLNDISATTSGVMTNIGHRLGLYAAMAGAGELSSQQLAEKTGLTERYLREWLNNQVAGGYLDYTRASNTYSLPDAHIPVLVDADSPVFLAPAMEVAAAMWHGRDKLMEVFESGGGIPWGEQHHSLFCGSESMFRPGYRNFLVSDWIGACEGLSEKLETGARVADIGCGHGASTIAMAQAFGNSEFVGFDSHAPSIAVARTRAEEAGSIANCRFETCDAQSYSGPEYDLICFMDCLHDMGDPVGAAHHAGTRLKTDGRLLLVEPAAADSVADNINPVSRLYYAASTAICTPCSRSQHVGLGLGAQAGEGRLSQVLEDAGFSSICRVAETPFNIILEARK